MTNVNLLIIFFVLTALNVILSTVKSLITVNGSPATASLVNAGYYGLKGVNAVNLKTGGLMSMKKLNLSRVN